MRTMTKTMTVLLASILALILMAIPALASETYVFVAKWGAYGDGDGQFKNPRCVAIDSSGNIYVADYGNNRIQQFTSSGGFLAKWGAYGSGNGQFQYTYGVAVDGAGNVYVSDLGNSRIQKFTSSGSFLAKWGAYGSGDSQFRYPYSIAVDGAGNVYVSDLLNNRIQKFTSTGTFLAKWGSRGGGDGQFQSPYGVATDSSGNVYVADYSNNRIQKFTSTGTFLAKWGAYGSGDGQFMNPIGVAIDGAGNVYVADYYNNRIQKFTSTGTFLTKWGAYGSGDGQLKNPIGVAIDGAGYVYVSDYYNNRIQKFYPAADTVPPTTTILTSPGADAAGWNNTDVTVSLTASDDPGGSGVARTEYSFDGTTWNTYSAPFMVTAEGTTTVYYRSTDKAGNVEAAKTQTISIDRTAPEVSITTDPGTLWPPNHKMVAVTIGGSATDSLSDIASISFKVTDEYGTTEPTISGFNTSIQLEAWRDGKDKDGRVYTISVTIKDNAGNETTSSVTIICPHDQGK